MMARKDMLMFFKSVVFGVVDFISDFRLLIFCLMSTTVEIQYYGVAMIFVTEVEFVHPVSAGSSVKFLPAV